VLIVLVTALTIGLLVLTAGLIVFTKYVFFSQKSLQLLRVESLCPIKLHYEFSNTLINVTSFIIVNV